MESLGDEIIQSGAQDYMYEVGIQSLSGSGAYSWPSVKWTRRCGEGYTERLTSIFQELVDLPEKYIIGQRCKVL